MIEKQELQILEAKARSEENKLIGKLFVDARVRGEIKQIFFIEDIVREGSIFPNARLFYLGDTNETMRYLIPVYELTNSSLWKEYVYQ